MNGQPKNLITRFTDLGDGILTADAEELRNSGILPDGAAMTGEVRLDEIYGLGWRLIEPEQTIRFIVPDELLAPHIVDTGPASADQAQSTEDRPEGPAIDHGIGLVLNYGLNFETRQGQGDFSTTGQFDTRFFMPFGALNHGFVLAETAQGRLQHRRLDTYWRSSFPDKSFQIQLGDLSTRGPSWARPVRLGGAMIERNFALRPDMVTLPLPGFEGRAELPSTVEVYANSVRSFSTEVPEGPFQINDLPFGSGAGMARIVIRDVTGRETAVDLPYVVSDQLLRRGMADFSLAAGRPRLGIASDADHYISDFYGVATLRYGLSDSLTLLAHAEGGKGLAMAGLGTTFRVGQIGTATISFAQSNSDKGSGSLVDLSTRLSLGRTQISGRVMATSGEFMDIAGIVAKPVSPDQPASGFPRHAAQIAVSTPLGQGNAAGASLFMSDMRFQDQSRESSLGISYSQQILGDASLTLSAVALKGREDDKVFGAQLHIPLGERRSSSLSIERRRNESRFYASASGRSKSGVPGWDWRLNLSRDHDTQLQGSAAYEGKLGRVEVAGRLDQRNHSIGLRLDGSIVAAGGGVFLSRRISDAFAVVDVGAPGVEVSAENRPVGRSGRSGKILVPDLRAYEANTITIDPANLPVDAAVGPTKQIVRPAHHAGARIDFGVSTSAQEALIELLGPDGRPLEVGGKVVVNGQDNELLVGFDGEVFAFGLQDHNEIEVSYPDGRRCLGRFDYADQPGTLTEIPGVLCQ